jgi:hypothetical protein
MTDLAVIDSAGKTLSVFLAAKRSFFSNSDQAFDTNVKGKGLVCPHES